MFKRFFLPLIIVLTLGSLSLLQASNLTGMPDTSKGPVVVNVSMLLLNVNEIKGASQKFNADVFFRLEWQDDRLAHSNKDLQRKKLDEIWYPNMQFANEISLRSSLPRIANVSSDGHVVYIQRMIGDFSQVLNLSEFPFDKQTFELLLVNIGGVDKDKIKIKPLNDQAGFLADNFSLPDWHVLSHTLNAVIYKPSKVMPGNPAVSFKFVVKRKIGFYWLHIILPLIFIVIMSMNVFWIPTKQAAVQIGLATTSMLTLIAYRFSIAGTIPPVSYLTKLDTFVLISTILVFFALIQALVTAQMADKGKEELAMKFDLISRFLVPFIFLITILYVLVLP